ncbi:epididymal sperm-binding protein 1-like [Oscarella lobularis]|uniref:epididymal sperm-binding protein 1-like n=1 Tax=Oscarella lobularis TaxID=121494 RepID=UPI00331377DD
MPSLSQFSLVVFVSVLCYAVVVQGMAVGDDLVRMDEKQGPSVQEIASAIKDTVKHLANFNDPQEPISGPSFKDLADAVKSAVKELAKFDDAAEPNVGPSLKEIAAAIQEASGAPKVTTCGGTAIEGERDCVFPFIYQGQEFHGCITLQHNQPWCATAGGVYESHQKWGNCECVSGEELSITTCAGSKCVFPFTYNGREWHNCTSDNHDQPWCSIAPGNYEVHQKYGNCLCQEEDNSGKTRTCGGTANGAPCTFPFTYHGKVYHACTTYDAEKPDLPWCMTDGSKWGNCKCPPGPPIMKDNDKNAVTTCGGSAGDGVKGQCFFPFYFDNRFHYNCITTDDRPEQWCGTNAGQVEVHGNWGFCKSC